MKNICVFCGSSKGNDPVFVEKAVILARQFVRDQITMVYGGGSIGIMGVLADEIRRRNGYVIGVIPRFLYDLEVGHDGVNELIIVDSMHERKQKMAEISDGFLALPGGFGTLEEMSEILTWVQLKLIQKPVGILNIHGFFDPLLELFDRMVETGFLKKTNRDVLIVGKDPEMILQELKSAPAFTSNKWHEKT
jgi:uncharacterized protein (TIGR00730 family)